jgi:hypothetical protein
MKYLLFIIALFSGAVSYCQVTKYKAYQKYWDDFKLNKPISEDKWDSANIVVVMDFTKMKVRTFGQETGDFDLITLKDVKDIGVGKSYIYEGVDNSGDKCLIGIQFYSDKTKRTIAGLKIVYDEFGLYFRLEED